MVADASNGDPSRQFCFAVASPEGHFDLQAESAVEQASWVASLQVRGCLPGQHAPP